MAVDNSTRGRSTSAPTKLGLGLVAAASVPLGVGRPMAASPHKLAARQQDKQDQESFTKAGQQTGLLRSRKESAASRPSTSFTLLGAAPAANPGLAIYGGRTGNAGLTRSISAPVLGAHLAPLIGPLFGSLTTKTSQALLAQLHAAYNTMRASTGTEQLTAQFDYVSARQALLRRDTKQDADLATLVSAPVERAFESILTTELLTQLPAPLRAQMEGLGRAMADALENLSEAQLSRMVPKAVADLKIEYPRPWSHEVELMAVLCEGRDAPAEQAKLIAAFLRSDFTNHFDCLGSMVLMRACFLGYKATGLDSSAAPWLRRADAAYQDYILDHKGGISGASPGNVVKDAVAGITQYGQASPLAALGLRPGGRAVNRASANLSKDAVKDAISFGNPYVSGISGTTNLFLHAAAHFNGEGSTQIDGAKLTTMMAAMLCYDGGHSIHEVYAVGNLLRDVVGIDLSAFHGYETGHARDLFVRLATRAGATDLEDRSFDRLREHFSPNDS